MHHIYQIGRCQRNCREGIPTARLHTDAHILAQLVVNGRNLRFAGSNRHSCIRVYLLDLAIDTLHHRLIGVIILLEDFDELLGTDVIGQRPQTLAGTAGQQDDIHKLLLLSERVAPRSRMRLHDSLAFGTHRIIQEILVGQAQTVFQLGLVGPARLVALDTSSSLRGVPLGLVVSHLISPV